MISILMIPLVILGIGAIVQILSHQNLIIYLIIGIFVVAIAINSQNILLNRMQFSVDSLLNVVGIVSIATIVFLMLFPKKA